MAEHNGMIEQLRDAAARVSEIEKQLNDPSNNTSYASLLREYHRLVPLSAHYHTVCALYDRKRQAEELAASEENSEYKRMAAEELVRSITYSKNSFPRYSSFCSFQMKTMSGM